jgi:predicted nucleic acid-binding protein
VARTDLWVQVVCDAGPLIHLDELGCIDLLLDFEQLLIPRQVWDEVERHQPSALRALPADHRPLEVELSIASDFEALVRALSLDLGEQAALSLMERHPQGILLTDDAAARLAAQALGFRAHGTIGVLLRSIRRNQRSATAVLEVLRMLPTRSTLHLRSGLLQEFMDQVEQMEKTGEDA